MNNLHNIDDITRGAIAVICSQVLPKKETGLTVSQTAHFLKISVSTLVLMRANNAGPRFYREDGKILYFPSSVRMFTPSKRKAA